MDYKIGDVILFRTKPTWNPLTWVAAGIRLFTNYRYNHVGVVVFYKEELYLFEMIEKGLDKTKLEERLKDHDISVLRSDDVQPYFSYRADNIQGLKGYDFISLFLYQPIFQLTNIWLGRKGAKADNIMYCSEYAMFLHNVPKWWLYSPDMIPENKKFKKII